MERRERREGRKSEVGERGPSLAPTLSNKRHMGVGRMMENGLISAMDGAWTLLGFNKLISGTAKQLLADAKMEWNLVKQYMRCHTRSHSKEKCGPLTLQKAHLFLSHRGE